jgi:exopolysaccharide biosynthesis polyprenyl glycosylphosphotransferase
MARYFEASVPEADYRLIGFMSTPSLEEQDRRPLSSSREIVAELLHLGHVQALGDLLVSKPVHEVIAIQPARDGEWVKSVIERCDYLGVLLRIIPEALLFDSPGALRNIYRSDALQLPAIVLSPPHLDSESLFLKRVCDVVISAVLLVLLSPLLLLIAVAIKISNPDLPVIYRYKQAGKNGVEFFAYKFTSMIRNAEAMKPRLMQQNEMSGPVFKIANDPRVTRIGRILRKYSFNELPQLWNVLRGDMSLVGPRPALPEELERYEFWHKRKLSFNAGITCLWQVRGRNKITNFDDWVRMDLEYIDNWSLWLDFKILIRTAFVVLRGTGS